MHLHWWIASWQEWSCMLWHMVSLNPWTGDITKWYVFRSGRCLLCINYYDKLYDSVVYKFGMEKSRIVSVSGMAAIFFNTVPGNKNIKRTEWGDTENHKSSWKIKWWNCDFTDFCSFGYPNLHFSSVHNESNEKARIIKRDRCEKH